MLTVRRLAKNQKGQSRTLASSVIDDAPRQRSATKPDGNSPGVGAVVGRSVDLDKAASVPAESVVKDNRIVETAAGAEGMGSGAMIKNRNMYNSILEGFVTTDIESTDAIQQGRSKDISINRIFRDIYYHDPVCGSAVDLMSNMPFSDFSLAGSKDAKVYDKYEQSLDNMSIKSLFPILSTEYLVEGLFVSTTLFDEGEGVFNGIVPQNIDYVEIVPVPVFGRDPLINLMVGEAAKTLMSNINDERMKEYEDLIHPKEDTLQPNPEDVIYIPRRALLRDYRGVSIYRRMLTAWLLERALYRGTLDQSMKRQRSITHLIAGDTDWTPTNEEMQHLASNLVAADLDPVGAIFVTRTGIQVNDIRNANDLWKVMDNSDYFTTAKLRSLGISESFLSGDASYNSLEQSMSVFIEQMRAYREMISHELFYNNTFPRIAQANDFYQKRYALETAAEDRQVREIVSRNELRQLDLFGKPGLAPSFVPSGYRMSEHGAISSEERKNLFIPEVHWHKRLRPEADDQYMAMLATLEEHGVPIPVRIWAAAGGLDINAILPQQDDDLKLRERIKPWLDKIKPMESQDGGGMGGGFGGGGGGGDEAPDLSSIINAAHTKRRGLLNRTDSNEEYAARNMSGGKRHIMSRKGEKIMNEKINKQIAEVASSVNQRMNKFEQKMEDLFRDRNPPPQKHYT